MNRYITEVIDAHIAIENWLDKGEGDPQTLLSRFAADFSMIALNGSQLDRSALEVFFMAQKQTRPGLRIVIGSMDLIAEWSDGAVVKYSERQILPEQSQTIRWSTAVFRLQEGQVYWRLLQETQAGE